MPLFLPPEPPPDLSGLVTEQELEAAIANLPAPPDLSGLVTDQELSEAIANLPAPPDLSEHVTQQQLNDSILGIDAYGAPCAWDLYNIWAAFPIVWVPPTSEILIDSWTLSINPSTQHSIENRVDFYLIGRTFEDGPADTVIAYVQSVSAVRLNDWNKITVSLLNPEIANAELIFPIISIVGSPGPTAYTMNTRYRVRQ